MSLAEYRLSDRDPTNLSIVLDNLGDNLLTVVIPVLTPPECNKYEYKSFESGETVYPWLELVCRLRRGRDIHHVVDDLSREEQLYDPEDRQDDTKQHMLRFGRRQKIPIDASSHSTR